jgi:hypothetical protein
VIARLDSRLVAQVRAAVGISVGGSGGVDSSSFDHRGVDLKENGK